jgi:hypothetical protein
MQASDREIDVAVHQLAEALGRAPRQSEIARLHRGADGGFVMAHYAPHVSRRELGPNADTPWRHLSGMGVSTAFASIEDVARMLNDPASLDAEVQRRSDLRAEFTRTTEEQNARDRADAIREDQERRSARIRVEQAAREFRSDDWGRLPPVAKVCFAVALAISDGGDSVAELRRLGAELGRTETIAFPGRRWW